MSSEKRGISDQIADDLGKYASQGIPTAVGLFWYQADNYNEFLTLFSDADTLPPTFEAWLKKAKDLEQDLKSKGVVVKRASPSVAEFKKWCEVEEFTVIDKHARGHFASYMAAKDLPSRKRKKKSPK